MKLAIAALCIVPAVAFAPRSASFGTRHSTLNAVATSDVRIAFALHFISFDFNSFQRVDSIL